MFRITMILFSLLLSGQALADEEIGRRFVCRAYYNDFQDYFLSPEDNTFIFDLDNESSWPDDNHEFTMPYIDGSIVMYNSVWSTNDVEDSLRLEIYRVPSSGSIYGTECTISFRHRSSSCILNTMESQIGSFTFTCLASDY